MSLVSVELHMYKIYLNKIDLLFRINFQFGILLSDDRGYDCKISIKIVR